MSGISLRLSAHPSGTLSLHDLSSPPPLIPIDDLPFPKSPLQATAKKTCRVCNTLKTSRKWHTSLPSKPKDRNAPKDICATCYVQTWNQLNYDTVKKTCRECKETKISKSWYQYAPNTPRDLNAVANLCKTCYNNAYNKQSPRHLHKTKVTNTCRECKTTKTINHWYQNLPNTPKDPKALANLCNNCYEKFRKQLHKTKVAQ